MITIICFKCDFKIYLYLFIHFWICYFTIDFFTILCPTQFERFQTPFLQALCGISYRSNYRLFELYTVLASFEATVLATYNA